MPKPRTITIPEDDAEFLEAYARQHDMSVQDVIQGWIKLLKRSDDVAINPSVEAISGLVPSDVSTALVRSRSRAKMSG